MSGNFWQSFGIGLIAGGIFCLLIVTGSRFNSIGYKKGQVDALNGKIKYELVEQPNGSTSWQKIKDTNDDD